MASVGLTRRCEAIHPRASIFCSQQQQVRSKAQRPNNPPAQVSASRSAMPVGPGPVSMEKPRAGSKGAHRAEDDGADGGVGRRQGSQGGVVGQQGSKRQQAPTSSVKRQSGELGKEFFLFIPFLLFYFIVVD